MGQSLSTARPNCSTSYPQSTNRISLPYSRKKAGAYAGTVNGECSEGTNSMSISSEAEPQVPPRRSRFRGAAIVAALFASTVAPVVAANSAGAQTSWNGFAVSDLPTSLGRATPGWSLATTNDLGGSGLDLWQTNHGAQSESLADVAAGGLILRATLNLGADGDTDSHGAAFADIDGDGDDDLFEVSGRTNNNSLFRNNNGILQAIPAGGLEDFAGRGRMPVFFDFDNDGDLDVFVSNLDGLAQEVPEDQRATATSRIYLNNGDGTAWTEVADPNNAINDANIPNASFTSLGPTTLNRLVTHNVFNVALDSVRMNTGVPLNESNGAQRVTDLNVPTRDVIVGDFDGDLYPEFIAFGGDAEVSAGTWPVRAFEVTPNGNARNVSLPTSADLDNCRSGTSGDFDNDGDLDIIAGCTQLQEGQDRNVLLLNDGFGNFSDAGTGVLPRTNSDTATAMVSGDVNGDGFLDAIVANGYDFENAIDHVITNQGGNGNWIAFDLDGSNPGAVGAQVFVGADEWQVRETGHAVHASQDSRRLHFGLGQADDIAPVLVQWPNGERAECDVPGINQVINLSQGSSNCRTITGLRVRALIASTPVIPVDQFCQGNLVTVDLSQGEIATAGNDVILGTEGNDTIFGRNGDDIICGLGGDDVIDAGWGNDTVYAGVGNDSVVGLRGADTIFGGIGNDTLNGGNDDDNIFGGGGADTLLGGNGNDRLFGTAGNDRLLGQNGDDVLNGGTGINRLFGGNNTDHCGLGATRLGCELTLLDLP